MRVLFLFALAACSGVPVAAHGPDAPTRRPPDAERYFTIWLGGARVGTAVERETWSERGVALVREEHLHFRRGQAPVDLVTTIAVDASPALVPSKVVWTERGAATRSTLASRTATGWTHAELPADAIPAELVPLLVARDGRFDAPVFLPARGFVLGHGHVEPVAPTRLVARLAFAGGAHAEATIDITEDGSYARVIDGEGVIAMRATAAEASADFAPVDLIAATAIPIRGSTAGPITLLGDGIEIELAPWHPRNLPDEAPSSDRTPEIELLVAKVQQQITPDLGAGPSSTADAIAATAGDCTTYALAYAAHARERAIPTHVVTGLRVDGHQLIRHRWAVSWNGSAWIAVDAAFGAAPAGPDLLGLAVHEADDAGLLAGEAALRQVRGALRGE